MKSNRLDLTNKIFNDWRVIRYAYTKHKVAFWECVCKCGKVKNVSGSSLKRNLSKSCGKCFSIMSNSYEYRVYLAMLDRCYRKSHSHYHRYGGRGIAVCEHWRKSFNNFLSDMRVAPEGYSLDRINNDGNYEPSNCRWATKKEQSNNASFNRIIEFENKKYTLSQLSEKLNIKYTTLKRRIDLGKRLDKNVNKKIEVLDAKVQNL